MRFLAPIEKTPPKKINLEKSGKNGASMKCKTAIFKEGREASRKRLCDSGDVQNREGQKRKSIMFKKKAPRRSLRRNTKYEKNLHKNRGENAKIQKKGGVRGLVQAHQESYPGAELGRDGFKEHGKKNEDKEMRKKRARKGSVLRNPEGNDLKKRGTEEQRLIKDYKRGRGRKLITSSFKKGENTSISKP